MQDLHVRLHQTFPDTCITLNLVSYFTFWLSIYTWVFSSKFWHIKFLAGYLFGTERNVIHMIISSFIYHVRSYQIFSDIALNLVSYMYVLIINIPVFFQTLTYKTSIWVFIWHRKKCYTHNCIMHHLSLQMAPNICRYHSSATCTLYGSNVLLKLGNRTVS